METYYNPADLKDFGNMGEDSPELWEKFMGWYGGVFAEGALTAREKSLIAFGVALAVECPYCIDSFTRDLLSKGCTREQITEAMHASAAITGGATLAHGLQAKNVMNKLEM
jgi:alkylhydroperoxidase/carboxymuconolactone decarboxylase family protein